MSTAHGSTHGKKSLAVKNMIVWKRRCLIMRYCNGLGSRLDNVLSVRLGQGAMVIEDDESDGNVCGWIRPGSWWQSTGLGFIAASPQSDIPCLDSCTLSSHAFQVVYRANPGDLL